VFFDELGGNFYVLDVPPIFGNCQAGSWAARHSQMIDSGMRAIAAFATS
jgi:hypothetical protein